MAIVRTGIAITALLMAFGQAAQAESAANAAEVLQKSHLIGKFSSDCSAPNGEAERTVTYTILPDHSSAFDTSGKPPIGAAYHYHYIVLAATLVGKNRVRIEARSSNNEFVSGELEKEGSGYRTISVIVNGRVQVQNGYLLANHRRMPMMNACHAEQEANARPQSTTASFAGLLAALADRPRSSPVEAGGQHLHAANGYDLIKFGGDPETKAQFWAATRIDDICRAQAGGTRMFFQPTRNAENLTTVVTIPDESVLWSNEQTKKLMQEAVRLHLRKCQAPKATNWYYYVSVIQSNQVGHFNPGYPSGPGQYALAFVDYSNGQVVESSYSNVNVFRHQTEVAARQKKAAEEAAMKQAVEGAPSIPRDLAGIKLGMTLSEVQAAIKGQLSNEPPPDEMNGDRNCVPDDAATQGRWRDYVRVANAGPFPPAISARYLIQNSPVVGPDNRAVIYMTAVPPAGSREPAVWKIQINYRQPIGAELLARIKEKFGAPSLDVSPGTFDLSALEWGTRGRFCNPVHAKYLPNVSPFGNEAQVVLQDDNLRHDTNARFFEDWAREQTRRNSQQKF